MNDLLLVSYLTAGKVATCAEQNTPRQRRGVLCPIDLLQGKYLAVINLPPLSFYRSGIRNDCKTGHHYVNCLSMLPMRARRGGLKIHRLPPKSTHRRVVRLSSNTAMNRRVTR